MNRAPTPSPGSGQNAPPPQGAAVSNSHPLDRADAPLVESDLLLQGQREIRIAHNGVTYRLQATRLGKLILTK